jgi:proton-dependent oligopeptide transporter, POT family
MASIQPDDLAVAALAEAKKDEFEAKTHVTRREQEALERAEEDSIYNDHVHDGLTFPTDEEIDTLRKVPDKIPWASYRA